MNQKGIATWIIVAIIVVAAVAVGGVVLLTMRPAAPPEAPRPPTPPPGEGIREATSLSFKVDTTVEGERATMTVRWRADNKLRVEGTVAGQEIKVIVDGGAKKAWVWTPEIGWQDISAFMPWSEIERAHVDVYEGYREALFGWTGGEFTYTVAGVTVRIYDIVINPVLPDALFQPD